MPRHPLAAHFDAYPDLGISAAPRSAVPHVIEAIQSEIDRRGLAAEDVLDVGFVLLSEFRTFWNRTIWAFDVEVTLYGHSHFAVKSNHRAQYAWRTYEAAQLADFDQVNVKNQWPIHVQSLMSRRAA